MREWDKTTQGCKDNQLKKKKISFNTSYSPLSKAKGAMYKPESWNVTNQTTKGPKASSVQFLYSLSCASGLHPLSHIPHFFSFTQNSQSLCLYHFPLLCFLSSLSSQFSVPRHLQATQPRSRHLLTHLRGAQPQIINYDEGKLNHFHHSFKSLNVFSFWIDFLILWIYNLEILI